MKIHRRLSKRRRGSGGIVARANTIRVTGAAYVWSAAAVALIATHAIVPNAVSYSWTAQAVTLQATRTLPIAGASYAWTADAIGLTAGSQRSVVMGAATYAWAADDFTAAVDYIQVPDAATFTWSASDVNLNRSVKQIVAGGATYAWTAQALTLTKAARAVTIDAASYSWTASAVTLTFSGASSPVTVFQRTDMIGTDAGTGGANLTMRSYLEPLDTAGGTPTEMRFTLRFGTASSTTTNAISDFFAGRCHPTDVFAFANPPARVTFGGNNGCDSSPGGVVVSDWVSMPEAYLNTEAYLFSFHIHTTDNNVTIAYISTGVDFSGYIVGNSASNQTDPGMSAIGGTAYLVEKMEVR